MRCRVVFRKSRSLGSSLSNRSSSWAAVDSRGEQSGSPNIPQRQNFFLFFFFHYLHYKLLVNVLFGHVGLEVGRLQEPQEELVDELQRHERKTEDVRAADKPGRNGAELGGCLRTCRCGHAASSVGSSSSGSNSAPVGLDDGGSVLNIFIANCKGGGESLGFQSKTCFQPSLNVQDTDLKPHEAFQSGREMRRSGPSRDRVQLTKGQITQRDDSVRSRLDRFLQNWNAATTRSHIVHPAHIKTLEHS